MMKTQGKMKIQIKAVGVIVRAKLRECCPNCETRMTEADALGARSTGKYPVPPIGTRGYLCSSCGHVEYVRVPTLRERVYAWLRKQWQ